MKELKFIVLYLNSALANNTMLIDPNGMGSIYLWSNYWLNQARICILGLSKLIIATELKLDISVGAKSLKSRCVQEVKDKALVIAGGSISLGFSLPKNFFYFFESECLTQ